MFRVVRFTVLSAGLCAWLLLLVKTLPEARSLGDALLIGGIDTALIAFLTGGMAWAVDLASIAAGIHDRAVRRHSNG
ncbi:hypothetical protein ABZN20_08840 [Methylococcus sp. ANG]|jgi:glycerol kinase|uniref:hypothetical protein n=1 Tax=unclassified Methylococcus TaxID=2618889 RepID=UPI001C52A9A7|nr:hypothetical protein [Methylococcus sp. Mc7]QXP84564.1 hypothetical protein KW115_02020 [Methylococcus sp. Mc7]